jgi:hypothetical protein
MNRVLWMVMLCLVVAGAARAATLSTALYDSRPHVVTYQPGYTYTHYHDILYVRWSRSDDGDWDLLFKPPGPPSYVSGGLNLQQPEEWPVGGYYAPAIYMGPQSWEGVTDPSYLLYQMNGIQYPSFPEESAQFVFKYLVGTSPNQSWNYLSSGIYEPACATDYWGWTAYRTYPYP